MSPEQIQAPGEVDHRADIYALGVVFYQMLTGELPGKKIEPPSHKVQIDVRLDEIVLRALEKNPELRYQQVSEVKTMVETIVSTPPGGSRREEAQTEKAESGKRKAEMEPRFSRTAIVGACWATFVVVGLAGMFIALHARAENPPSGVSLLFLIIGLPLALLGLTAPFATTILGWIAVSQIRRSAGKLHGLWLAVFDGLFFPLFALDGLIWYLCIISTLTFRNGVDASNRIQHAAGALIVSVIISVVVDWLIIRVVWRAVNNSGAGVPPAEPARKNLAGKIITIVCGVLVLGAGITVVSVHQSVNDRLRAASLTSAEFHYRVFVADAALVDRLIPAGQRQHGVQSTTKAYLKYSGGGGSKMVNNGTNSFKVTMSQGPEIDSWVANISPETLDALLDGVGKSNILADGTQTISGVWWPGGMPTIWSYSQQDGKGASFYRGGNGGINLAIRQLDGQNEIRIEGEIHHQTDLNEIADITSKFLYEGKAPQNGALAFLVPFFRQDNSEHYLVVVYDVSPRENASEPKSPPENGVIQFKFLRVEVPKGSHRIELYFERDKNYGLGIEVTQTALPGPNGEHISLDFWLEYGHQTKWVGVNQPSVLVWRLPEELSDEEIQAGVKELEHNAKRWTQLYEGSNPEFAHIKSREGWTYVLWSHVLREPDLRPLPVTSIAAQNLSFGPVTMRTIQAVETGTNLFLNLDTGQLLTPPADIRALFNESYATRDSWEMHDDPRALKMRKWLRNSGANLMVGDGGRGSEQLEIREAAAFPPNVGSNGVVVPFGFDQADANYLATRLQRMLDGLLNQQQPYKTIWTLQPGFDPRLNARQDSFCFKTANGAVGILQIVNAENSPAGVRVRYKLVQNATAATSNYPGDWIWEQNSETLARVPPIFLLRPSTMPTNWVSFDMTGKDRYLARGKTLKELIVRVWSQKNSTLKIVFEAGLPDDKYDFIVTAQPQWWNKLESEIDRRFNLVEQIENRDGVNVVVVKSVSPTAPAAAPNLSFGSVEERDLTGDAMLDFESGQVEAPPDFVYSSDSTIVGNVNTHIGWMKQKGFDFGFVSSEAVCIGSKVIALLPGDLTNLTARVLMRQLALDQGSGPGAVALHYEVSVPFAFGFQTHSGRIGILQLTGSADNPRGVKIRYKLVQNSDAEQSLSTNQNGLGVELKTDDAKAVLEMSEQQPIWQPTTAPGLAIWRWKCSVPANHILSLTAISNSPDGKAQVIEGLSSTYAATGSPQEFVCEITAQDGAMLSPETSNSVRWIQRYLTAQGNMESALLWMPKAAWWWSGIPGHDKGRLVIGTGGTNIVVLMGKSTSANLAKQLGGGLEIRISLIAFPRGVIFDPQKPVTDGTDWLKHAQ